MAEEITLKVNVETGKAVTNLGNLEKATKGVTQATKQADKGAETLEQQFDTLNKEIKEGPVNIRRMNKQIQEYQAIALEAGRTSPLGKKAIQEAAQLKDRYNDITAEVNRLANDGVKMQAALDIGTTVIAGYAAFQGALAIAGVDSEKYRETLMKLQGAQSLLMGVETLRKNLEKESTVVLVAKTTAEKIATIATTAYTFVTGGATIAVNALRFAMLAIPFVAIGAAIIALVQYWDEFVGAIKSALKWIGVYDDSEEQSEKKRKKRLKAEKKAREKRLAEIKSAIEDEIRARDRIITSYDDEIRIAESLGKDTVELERQKLTAIIESFQKQKELEIEGIRIRQLAHQQKIAHHEKELKNKIDFWGTDKALLEAHKRLLEETLKDEEDFLAQLHKAEVDLVVFENKIQLKRREAYKKTAEENKKVTDKEIEDTKKAAEDKLKIELAFKQNIEKLENELLLSVEKLDEQARQRALTDQEKEIEAVNLKYFALINDTRLGEEEILRLKTHLKEEEALINDKFAKEQLQKDQAVKDAKTQLALDGLTAVMSLTSAFAKDNEKSQKKAFEINKKLQIAQALIQTYQGVQAIFASASANPITVGFPAYPFIQAGIALASGLANVQNIRKQQFSGGGGGGSFGGGGGVPGGGGAAAPQIAPVTNTSTLVPQEDQKVFVTETDISDTQNKVSVIEAQSTF